MIIIIIAVGPNLSSSAAESADLRETGFHCYGQSTMIYSLVLHFLRGIYSGVLMMIVHCDSELFSLQDLCSTVYVALVSSCQNNFTSTAGTNAWWTRAELDLDKTSADTSAHIVPDTSGKGQPCSCYIRILLLAFARTCPQG
jgi:hypothetical protein